MSDVSSNSLRAITHQLDSWLTLHGDRTRVLRAMLLLQEELHSLGASTPVGNPTEQAVPGPAKVAEAPQAGGDDAAALVASLLGGFLPHSAVQTVMQQVDDVTKAAEVLLGGQSQAAVSSTIAEVVGVAKLAQNEAVAKIRDILTRLGAQDTGAKGPG